MGETTTGQRYYALPKPLISIRYLSDQEDKLMNRLILDGYALVLESDPMLSSDDSHCGCNCGCCFNLQAEGKTKDECSTTCGCDCNCCEENKQKLTQYWIDQKGAQNVAKQMATEYKKLSGKDLDDYMNAHFGETWDYYDVNRTGLIEIERMSSFYKQFLKDYTLDIQ